MSGENKSNVAPTSKEVEQISSGVTKSEPKIDILISRHGERLDFLYMTPEDRSWNYEWVKRCFPNGKYVRYDLNMPVKLPQRNGFPDSFISDTPLTNVGALQAKETGVGFAEAGVTIKYVYCSPALRSVETCHNILTGMGIVDKVVIRIEPAVFDYLYLFNGIQKYPDFMSDDELIAAGYKIDKTYIPAISREDLKKHLTEPAESYYQRNYDAVKRFIATAEKQGGGNILIVAHGYTLDTCTRQLTGKKPRSHDDLMKMDVPYCSVVRCQKENSTWTLRESPAPGLKILGNERFDFTKLL